MLRSISAIPVTHHTAREPMSFLFVRVETDDGVVGYGEACDSFGCSYASIVGSIVTDVLAPLLVGQVIDHPGAIAERLALATRRRLGSGWAAAHARSAVELALWDVVGKRAGSSVSSLHGRHRDRVDVYASIGFLEERDAEGHAADLLPLVDRGVTHVKTRIGPRWREDLVTLGRLRYLLPDGVELMVDGSETFTVATALLIASELAELGVLWFEEPLPTGAIEGIAELAHRSPVPIAYGEHLFGVGEAQRALAAGVQILQPDASTCGGLTDALAMAATAAVFGARVVPHVCAGPISLTANLHLAASAPAIGMVEYPPVLLPVWAALGIGAALGLEGIVDGTLAVPVGPGLGVDLDEAAAVAAPYRPPGARIAGTVGGLPDRFRGDR